MDRQMADAWIERWVDRQLLRVAHCIIFHRRH